MHTTKGKNGVWCRNTLELDIFRNPIEWSMCTRNDRDARLAERCLLLGEMEYIVPSYSFFSTSTLVILPRENSVSNK